MYTGCIYLPIQGTYVNHVEKCYEKLSVDISRFNITVKKSCTIR